MMLFNNHRAPSAKTPFIYAVLWTVFVLCLAGLASYAAAATVEDTWELTWNNPTTRTDGKPLKGALTATVVLSNVDGSKDIGLVVTEPNAERFTFVPASSGIPAGEYRVSVFVEEAGNAAGPSGRSESLGPFSVAAAPDRPPMPPVLLDIQPIEQ